MPFKGHCLFEFSASFLDVNEVHIYSSAIFYLLLCLISFFCLHRLFQATDRDCLLVLILFTIIFRESNQKIKTRQKSEFILVLHSTFLSENLKGENNHLVKLCGNRMIIEYYLRK